MKVTQRDRILSLLQQEPGHWVPAYELAEISLRYGARIHDLRKSGYEIELQTETVKGQVHTAYRLVYALETPQDALQTLLEGWYERVTSPHKEEITNEEMDLGPGNSITIC